MADAPECRTCLGPMTPRKCPGGHPKYYCSRSCRVRALWLRAGYGLTTDAYWSLFRSQGGLCPLCRKELGVKPCVDHSHETGVVRGLLCHYCNTGIGWLERVGFSAPATYLEVT